MSRHARIEEVSSSESDGDSDPEIMDPSALHALEPSSRSRTTPNPSLISPQQIPSTQQQPQQPIHPSQAKFDKTWIMLYPLYFDAAAHRTDGRRVSEDRAVHNPLASKIAQAIGNTLGTPMKDLVLEPERRHPKDWANPGRVRVRARDEAGNWVLGKSAGITNKRGLFNHIAAYLANHPTNTEDPLLLAVRGLPMPEDGGPLPPPAKPRGWKINDILPLHSAAVTGGGVRENIMQDLQNAMAEQQGGAPVQPKKIKEGKPKKGKK